MNEARKVLFQEWKKQSDVIYYKGFHMKHIISMEILLIATSGCASMRSLVRLFTTYNFKKHLKELASIKHNVLFSIGEYGVRKDFKEILEYVRSGDYTSSLVDFSNFKKKRIFSLSRILWAMKASCYFKKVQFRERIQIVSALCFYASLIDELIKVDILADKYCAFSSVHPIEAIFTEYFQQRNVTTYSLQHGIYYIYRRNFVADILSYENFNADFHLCWGEYSKKEFETWGIEPCSLIVAGYPRNINSVKKKIWNKKKCLVFLARPLFEEYNFILLKIIKQLAIDQGVVFSFKLHPSLNHELYQQLAIDNDFDIVDKSICINDIFSNNDFGWAISVNTTACYESYSNGLPCLRYSPEGVFDEAMAIVDNDFSNFEELKKIYVGIPFHNMADYLRDIEEPLQYIMGINLNNYKVIFNA